MFGRLKLALVALVLMPAAALAADPAPRHTPGAAAVETIAAPKKMVLAGTDEGARKHRSSAKVIAAGPSTIEVFLMHLGGASDVVATISSGTTKQAAAAIATSGASARPQAHRPG